jgi:hypothetical protein
MSESTNFFDVLDGPDKGRRFARKEGLLGYDILALEHPDSTISDIAGRAAQLAMIASGRFDVDPRIVAQEITDTVTADFPVLIEEDKKKNNV